MGGFRGPGDARSEEQRANRNHMKREAVKGISRSTEMSIRRILAGRFCDRNVILLERAAEGG